MSEKVRLGNSNNSWVWCYDLSIVLYMGGCYKFYITWASHGIKLRVIDRWKSRGKQTRHSCIGTSSVLKSKLLSRSYIANNSPGDQVKEKSTIYDLRINEVKWVCTHALLHYIDILFTCDLNAILLYIHFPYLFCVLFRYMMLYWYLFYFTALSKIDLASSYVFLNLMNENNVFCCSPFSQVNKNWSNWIVCDVSIL